MRKKSLTPVGLKPTKSNITSFETVLREGWFIKLSRFDVYIMLLFVSQFTGNIVIKYFDDEGEAVKYINYILNVDPTTLKIDD